MMLISSDFAIPKTKLVSVAKDSFNDELLWSNFKSGNELAMSMLYKKYVQRLYVYGFQ